MGSIFVNENKQLKLTNALQIQIDLSDEKAEPGIVMEKIQSYIRVKGTQQVGPLVQYMFLDKEKSGNEGIVMKFIVQTATYIHSIEKPYRMESVIRVPNCMYCRYIGPEEKLKFAYDKINLEAFENDIELTGESYTVFVDQNEEEGTIVADVFMPKAKDE